MMQVEGVKMIHYGPLWDTMKKKGITQYKLIKEYGFSTGQLSRLRANENVSTNTLNYLCEILDCQLEDIACYSKEDITNNKKLKEKEAED